MLGGVTRMTSKRRKRFPTRIQILFSVSLVVIVFEVR